MTRWIALGSFLLLLAAGGWALSRITRKAPDKRWSDDQDDGRRQVMRSKTGL